MSKVAIVDYGMGNLDSVFRAAEICGGNPCIANKNSDFESVTHIILPGVGSFFSGMENLRKRKLDKVLEDFVIKKGIPFLGICLGMQLLAKKGWEEKESAGLGFVDGEVKRFDSDIDRIPHVGWNEVDFVRNSALFGSIPDGKDFYFVHSYHFICNDSEDVIARTSYCGSFVSAIEKDNIFGVQFHPEKSQHYGLELIKNFFNI